MPRSGKGRGKNVCFLCLKRFEPEPDHDPPPVNHNSRGDSEKNKDISDLDGGGVPTSADAPVPTSEEGVSGIRYDLYSRFLNFVGRYLRLEATAERFREAATGSTEKVQTFCEDCEWDIRQLCDTYGELNAIKIRLTWKLSEIGETIRTSKKSVSHKLVQGLVKRVTEQINFSSISRVHVLRKQLALKCKLKSNHHNTTPKLTLHRGLFPDEWKFTYSATKRALMNLIVVFALATSAVYQKKTVPPALPDLEKSKRGRPRKRVRFDDIGNKNDVLVKGEVREEDQNGIDDDDYRNDLDDGFGNNSDSDWSGAAASPTSVGSAGSDADFSANEDSKSPPKRRWNLRRTRKSSTKSETDKETDGDSEDEKTQKKKKQERSKTGRKHKLHSKEPLPCTKCSKTFIDPRGLSRHLQLIHGSHIDYSCPHCGMKFKKQALMINHKRKMHKYQSTIRNREGHETKCTRCDQVFPSKIAMMQHRKTEHKVHWTKHECPICFKSVLTEDRFQWHLAAHERNVTKSVAVFYCEVCAKHFFKESSLSEHMVNVHNGSYPCSLCDANYPSSKYLRDHLETHETDVKNFQCTFCSRGFTHQQYFDVHRKLAHRDKQRLFCDKETCTEEFESIQELNEHLNTHVAEELAKRTADGIVTQNATPEEQVAVGVKGEGDTSENNSQEECEDGTRVFSCSHCGWGFLKKYNRELHELVHTPHSKDKKGYDCPICAKNLRYIDTLLTHYNRAHGAKIKPYKCLECNKTFSSLIWYKVHVRLHEERKSGESFVCDICDAECLDSVALSAHRRGHFPNRKGRNAGVIKVKDGSVPLEFIDRMDPASPPPHAITLKIRKPPGRPRTKPLTEEEIKMKKEKVEVWTDIPCEICEDKFESAYLLRKHYENVHETDEKTLPCTFCFKSYTLPQTYELHLKAVHKTKRNQFKCDDEKCEMCFISPSELNEHLKTHVDGEKSIEHSEDVGSVPLAESAANPDAESCKTENVENRESTVTESAISGGSVPCDKKLRVISYCKVCNWGFLNSKYLELHELVHIGKNPDGYGHNCPCCSESFSTTPHLVNHYNRNHGPNLKPYKCFECDKTFFSKLSQKLHINRHDRRRKPISESQPETSYVCIDCGAKCKDEYLLEKHRLRHNPENHLPCQECGEMFEDNKLLTLHLKKKHGQGERYPCPVCGVTFLFQYYIKQHMLSHQPARFKCEICDKPFKKIYTLRKHMKQHDPNRTAEYICADCGMAYKSEAGLKFHIDSIHTPESEKKFPCPYCPKRYHRSMLLKMHVKTCMRAQGIPGNNDNAQINAPVRKPSGKPRGRPRKKKAKVEEEEEDEEEIESTSEEEEEAPVDDSDEDEDEKPEIEEEARAEQNEEHKPRTVTAIDAIIANLTGMSEFGETHESRRMSTRRRISAGNSARQNIPAPTSVPATTSSGTSTFQSTVDHMLLQSLTHQQNLTAFPGNPSQHYQHWLSASAAAQPLNISLQNTSHTNDGPHQNKTTFTNLTPTTTSGYVPQLFGGGIPQPGLQQQHQQNTYSPNHVYSPSPEPQNLHYGNKYK